MRSTGRSCGRCWPCAGGAGGRERGQQGTPAADGGDPDAAGAAAAAAAAARRAADTLKAMNTRLDERRRRDAQGVGRPEAAGQRHRRHRAGPAREGRRHQRPAVDDDAGAARRCARPIASMPAPVAPPRRSGAASGSGDRRPAPPALARRRLARPARSLTDADVRPSLRRLQRRPVRPRGRWVPGLHPDVPDVAAGRRAQFYIGIRSTTPARTPRRVARSRR